MLPLLSISTVQTSTGDGKISTTCKVNKNNLKCTMNQWMMLPKLLIYKIIYIILCPIPKKKKKIPRNQYKDF